MGKKSLKVGQAKRLSRVDVNPDTSNLQNCIHDVRKAELDNDAGPDDPIDFSQLRGREEEKSPWNR